MLASFTREADGSKSTPGEEPVVEDLIHWAMVFTLNVISSASLNIKAIWPTHSVAATEDKMGQSESDEHTASNSILFQESFDMVMNNVAWLIVFPSWILRNSPIRFMRRIQKYSDDFLAYMSQLIASHQAKIASGAEEVDVSSGAGDLLGSIIKGSIGNKSATLSEQEMIGNIFVFVVAGHETTAITLQTALLLLACEPHIQREVHKEIDSIWAEKKSGEDLVYEDYGKMRYIMAVMVRLLPHNPWLERPTKNFVA
jgi:cytochrome P450